MWNVRVINRSDGGLSTPLSKVQYVDRQAFSIGFCKLAGIVKGFLWVVVYRMDGVLKVAIMGFVSLKGGGAGGRPKLQALLEVSDV